MGVNKLTRWRQFLAGEDVSVPDLVREEKVDLDRRASGCRRTVKEFARQPTVRSAHMGHGLSPEAGVD